MNKEELKTVSEVGKLAGISVRTLHYYDEIGLLEASFISENGYRFYDDTALIKLQQILFLKEMKFELKQIKHIIQDNDYDMKRALVKQREILMLKKVHMENLIGLIDRQLEAEIDIVELEVFNTMDIEKLQEEYKQEVENRWGNTQAYKECNEKTKQYSKDKWQEVAEKGDAILKEISEYRHEDASCEKVQELVEKWRVHISNHFYECHIAILQGLGEMYVADERFRKNIDKHGEGTAELLSQGINYYCNCQ